MKIDGTSASAYDTYKLCEFKWYLSYPLGFVGESGPAALLGTIGHKVLEVLSTASIVKHDKNSKIWDPVYLWNTSFNHYYNLEPNSAEQIPEDKIRKVSRGIINLLNSEYTPIRDNTISSEAQFYIPIEEPGFELPKEFIKPGRPKYFTIRGRIDRVDKIDDETVEIIDYKTGSRVCWDSKDRHKKEPSDLRNDIQPRMYHMAAKHLYPWAKNILVTFIYITDGGPIQVPFCDEDIKETKQILLKRYRAIRFNEEPQRNTGWHCNVLCDFGDKKSGVCSHVWKEVQEAGYKFVENKYITLNIRKKIK